MTTTEAIGGECPRCENNRCYIRTGTGTWYSYIACPECGFAYGQHADNVTETDGIVSGAYVFKLLLERFDYHTMDELCKFASEVDNDELYCTGDTIFNFDSDSEVTKNMCVAHRDVVNELNEA